ncbi:MAG: hypothetical protein JNL41_10025 [Phenylobacterium sp.]|uniref:hypothetical protein n=1 Tax=Phenylobacterium sp. TaxID=1871053 RepID=UPI001A569B57|nr:hypothetical protein [Phenylobacterium sp.]MBL8554603.1 hypothetical protein [Phenylobacterium sp.]
MVMHQAERDRMLLSLLPAADRAALDEVVEEIIEEEIFAGSEAACLVAAQMFDEKAADPTLLDDEKIVALQIAAAIRMRLQPPQLDD